MQIAERVSSKGGLRNIVNSNFKSTYINNLGRKCFHAWNEITAIIAFTLKQEEC